MKFRQSILIIINHYVCIEILKIRKKLSDELKFGRRKTINLNEKSEEQMINNNESDVGYTFIKWSMEEQQQI